MCTKQNINKIARWLNFASQDAGDMKSDLFDGGLDEEQSDVSCVEMKEIFSTQGIFFFGTGPFDLADHRY